ncbi:MAG: hypothetical protein OXG39_15820 [Chloroflexi bacterium]|nr:hypothetical protein [Chloroflexota bacterium]
MVAYTAGDIDTAKDIERRYQDLVQDHLLPDDMDYQEARAAFERADVQTLSDEQKLRIDYLLGTEDDPLTRSMLLAVKYEGIPGHLSFDEYMARFADWGLVEESDQRAWQVMQSNIKDLTNDRYESARAIDLNSGEEVFLRPGSRNSVLLQDEHKRMLDGRDIALIHNHPNNSPASNADLQAALDLGVMFLVLVTRSGLQYHYRRSGDEMKLVEVIHNLDYVALPSAEEDRESRAAYLAQVLAEAGNPAEIVMREDEPFWWQQDYIVVPYNGNETIEEVAARIVGPPPGQEISGESYEQLQEEYSKEITEFTAYLREINPGYSGVGRLYIPMPGWSSRNVHSPRGSQVRVSHATSATLLSYPTSSIPDQVRSMKLFWNSLSMEEQQIEMALMGSDANIDKFVTFANAGHDFDYTLDWLRTHEDSINQAASDFAVPSSLLNTVLGSELLYDYGHDDSQQDATMRSGFRDAALRVGDLVSEVFPALQESWDGTGIANAHYPALVDAYHFVKERLAPGETHPWVLDPKAPDLESAPKLDPSDDEKSAYVGSWADYYNDRSFDKLSQREQEVALFWIRNDKLDEVPWDLRQDIAYYAASVVGSIRMAAMISHMYGETLEDMESTANVADNPRDIARVWGRFRSADQYFDYLGNAHLAYPVADYWSKQ